MTSERSRQRFPETDIPNSNSVGGTCRGITKQGKQCRNIISQGNGNQYCYHHRGQATIKAERSDIFSSESVTYSPIAQADSKPPNGTCHGITLEGERCKKPVNKRSGRFCHLHQNKESTQETKAEHLEIFKSSPSESVTYSPIAETGSKLPSSTCHGTTRKGERCKKPVNKRSGRFCHLHQNKERTQETNAEHLEIFKSRPSEPVTYSPIAETGSKPPSLTCHGTTRKGERCKNPVKKGRGSFCHLHQRQYKESTPEIKQSSEQSRSVSPAIESREKKWVPRPDGSGIHIDLNEFLHCDLTAPCREKILNTVNRVLSEFEIVGYIYAYTIKERNSENGQGALIKVGLTKNVEKRLKQVAQRCRIDPMLVVRYPDQSPSTSLTPAKRVKCAATRRVERLILLELEDRLGNANKAKLKCHCGSAHREWFRGDEDVVREVIYRWARFSKIAYGDVSD